MAKNELIIGLFDPGMTHLHRVGLAGLYMTLRSLGTEDGRFETLEFQLEPTKIIIRWHDNGGQSFEKLFSMAFGATTSSPVGLIDFAAHRDTGLGDIQRYELHQAILGSFLQHNKQNMIPKGAVQRVSLTFEDKQVVLEYRPLHKYAHALSAKSLLNNRGELKESVPIKSWLYFGAAKRHENLSGTEIEEPPERFVCLLFAPVASVYFRLSRKTRDGSYDERVKTAVCLPHITNLGDYAWSYKRYLGVPVERLSACGLEDAALSALLLLKADVAMDKLGISGCTVVTMGTVNWSAQQKTRTRVISLNDIQQEVLDRFEMAFGCLPNKIVMKEQDKGGKKGLADCFRYVVTTSLARALVAENIASGRDWFANFSRLMCSSELAKSMGYEKGGIKKMVDQISWPSEADKKFVEAIHLAMRNRYGTMAFRAKQRGENIRFDREFERMRTGLMRAKNAQTLRAELADFFAKGGINKVLQNDWEQILGLVLSQDWQRSRDLALVALASYTGKGAEELVGEDQEISEEDE